MHWDKSAAGGRQCHPACTARTALPLGVPLLIDDRRHKLTCTDGPQLADAIAWAGALGGRGEAALNLASMSRALPARSPERQGMVLVVLDFEKDVQHHWPTAAGRSTRNISPGAAAGLSSSTAWRGCSHR